MTDLNARAEGLVPRFQLERVLNQGTSLSARRQCISEPLI